MLHYSFGRGKRLNSLTPIDVNMDFKSSLHEPKSDLTTITVDRSTVQFLEDIQAVGVGTPSKKSLTYEAVKRLHADLVTTQE